jgi:DNA topoisomerase-2
MKIIGLQIGKKYEDVIELRYGSIMIMTDQDHDGSHIKGLIINFIHHFWPSLLQMSGFLKEFVTPIIKVSKGNQTVQSFFTIPEYENWKSTEQNLKSLKIKYYKGLGTSTAKEGKEYF